MLENTLQVIAYVGAGLIMTKVTFSLIYLVLSKKSDMTLFPV
jgi:hypothetical protein